MAPGSDTLDRPTSSSSAPASAAAPAPARKPVEQQLVTAQDLFIRRWGEMGQTWGINRTMAEIHALLYIGGRPLCTDDVMERLHISRGNASMSLRALCDWGIVRRLHKRGERREYFESLGDVWEMFSLIATERHRRNTSADHLCCFYVHEGFSCCVNSNYGISDRRARHR